MNRINRALAVAVFATSAIPALHAAAEAPNGIVVAYGDLDLGTAAGRSELTVRVQDAASKLCSVILPDRNYRGSDLGIHERNVLYRACIGRLSDRAMTRIAARRD
jgi:UrcA family protein